MWLSQKERKKTAGCEKHTLVIVMKTPANIPLPQTCTDSSVGSRRDKTAHFSSCFYTCEDEKADTQRVRGKNRSKGVSIHHCLSEEPIDVSVCV